MPRPAPVMPRVTAPLRVLGCMSGTSADGIDVAAADLWLEGEELLCRYLGCRSEPFSAELRERIMAVLPPASPGAGLLCELDSLLGEAYAAAFAAAREEICAGHANLSVLHGQTVYHWVRPDGRAGGSLALGNAGIVAERTGMAVVSGLRSRDIAAGGQGAPLVPLFDALLFAGRSQPCGAINLGGIANITVLRPGEPVLAYDIGPAGALMDPAAGIATGGAAVVDAGGRTAARGRVCAPLLRALRADPFYRIRGPRSTGREHFNAAYLREKISAHAPQVGGDDLVATVTRLLADEIIDTARRHRLAELVFSGGGSRNRTTLAWVREGLPGTRVSTTDALGVPVQAKEALAFAVLGYLSWHGLPGSLPSATGARHPSILGSITTGDGPLRLPEPLPRLPRHLRLTTNS